jgi:HEAT repeat protein
MRIGRWAARATTVALLALVAAVSADETPDVTQLVESGQYRQAYEATVHSGTADPAAVADMARTLLGVSMKSEDSYERWFALQAAQPLKDQQLLDSVRERARAADRYERSLALEILARADPQGSRDELVAGLESPYRVVRIRALKGLIKLNDRTLTERFGTLLQNDPDPDLRALAARALGTTGAPKALPMLHRALDDASGAVQDEAVRAMVALHDPDVSSIMRRRLADNPSERRVQTLRTAGLVPDPDLIAALGPYLGDGDSEVRAFAAAAILSILEHAPPGKP